MRILFVGVVPTVLLNKFHNWRVVNAVDCLHKLSKVLVPHLDHPLNLLYDLIFLS